MFSQNQLSFISTFTDEFLRELEFISDIAAKRATSRQSFFDQVIGKFNLGSNIINTLMGFFPGGNAVSIVTQTAVCILVGMQYLYERDVNCNIDRIIKETRQPKLLLRLMIEGVARVTARRYEYFINNMCAAESIELFAVVGVARVLQYLSDHHQLDFTAENLLHGLIDGRSGAGQQGFQNNQLKTCISTIPTISAETVYGHSAYMTVTGKYYLKEKNSSYFKQSDKHFVKLNVDGFPKAGVAILRESDVKRYQYPETPITPQLDLYLNHYRPNFVYVTRDDIDRYMAVNKTLSISMKAYHQNKNIMCRDDLSGCNLSGGDFSDVDFCGVNLENANLDSCTFENAYLINTNLQHASAINANFRNANLSLLNAQEANFENCDFTQCKVFYSYFTGSNLTNIKFLGSEWVGSDLSSILTSPEIETNLSSLGDVITILSRQQKEYENRLNSMEERILEYLRNPDINIGRSVLSKLKKIQERILSDIELLHDLELYIPVQASFSNQPKELFDLDNYVKSFIQSENKVLLILGEAGEGKSTFNRYFHRQLWFNWNENQPIPLFIPLRSLKNPKNQLMFEALEYEMFNHEEMTYLQENYSFFIILDGYDEMTSTPNLYISNRLDRWQAKVTITCRKQYILQFPNYKRCFLPSSGERLLENTFKEVNIALFDEKQIDRYILKYMEIHHDDLHCVDIATYREEINKIPGLNILIQTPFLLMITMHVLPDIMIKYQEKDKYDQHIKKTELYETFMQWWFRRAEMQVILNETQDSDGWNDIAQDFEMTSEELAVEMIHADVTEVLFNTDTYSRNSDWYRQSFHDKKIITLCQQDLEGFIYDSKDLDKTLLILYIRDAVILTDRWRIVARNNAGGLTSHVHLSKGRSEWLTVTELSRRWSTRKSLDITYDLEIRKKVQILNKIEKIIELKTPETLLQQEQEQLFSGIVTGLTHPWERFFNFKDQKIRQVFHGLPVKPTSRGGYAFIHIEVLTYFDKRAGLRDIPNVIQSIEDNTTDRIFQTSNNAASPTMAISIEPVVTYVQHPAPEKPILRRELEKAPLQEHVQSFDQKKRNKCIIA